MLSNQLPGPEPKVNTAADLEEKAFERRIKYLDLFIKFLAGGVITLLVWYMGNITETSRQQIAEANRQMTYLMEFNAKQKELDVNLSMQMFETLLANYLKKEEKGDKQEHTGRQLLLLRLIALNFQDVPINLKPLFEELDTQLTDPGEKKKLRDISLELARRQAYRLTKDGFDSGKVTVTAGQKPSIENLFFDLEINEISHDHLKASLNYENRSYGPFTVSFFDMPIVDNIKIANFRVSLLLTEIDGKNATVRLIVFPSDLAADRFDLKELTRGKWLRATTGDNTQ
jgi:hypothetical protein